MLKTYPAKDMVEVEKTRSMIDGRLASLDILRGFDMFWIIGGGALLGSIITFLNWPALNPVTRHLRHTEWSGFTAWDLIFPLFIFISGVTMPFSFPKFLDDNRQRTLYFKIVRRALVLIVLGWLYNGLFKTLNFADTRYLSVLGLIGLAYLWASLIVINFKPLNQAIWAIGILLLYYVLMNFVPVPGYGPGVLTKEGNLASFIDRCIVPGKLVFGVSDPEGLLMTFPASVLAISGALSGSLLKNAKIAPYRKIVVLVIAGILCLSAGLLWNPYFPIIKKLWTSSFVFYTVGWSLLLLSIFYLVVDIWGFRKIFFPLVLIGVNPLTIYITAHCIINFEYTAQFLFGGFVRIAGDPLKPVVLSLAILVCELIFLFVLYKKKIFLKI